MKADLTGSITPELRNWIELVAHHAAQHVARGVPVEQAIERGIADYTRQLERLWDTASRRGLSYVTGERAARWEAAVGYVAERVYREVRGAR